MKTVKQLSKYNLNPRKITPQQRRILAKGLDKFGDLSGVVFNLQNNMLVGGNQRSDYFDPTDKIVIIEKYDTPDDQGTVSLGYIIHKGKKYSYREVYWDDQTHQAACLMANKGGGEWDWALVKQIGMELDTGAFDMEYTGFDNFEWENLITFAPEQNKKTEKKESNIKTIELSYVNQDYLLISKYMEMLRDEYSAIDNATAIMRLLCEKYDPKI